MNMKRRKEINSIVESGINIPNIRINPEFTTMYDLLRDAEKYLDRDEPDVCDSILTNLCDYIEYYKNRDRSKDRPVPPIGRVI